MKAKFVYNPYDKDFILKWDGQEYFLPRLGSSLLPEDVIKAFFPRNLEELWVDLNSPTAKYEAIRNFHLVLGRWGNQIQILGADFEDRLNEFFNFVSGFIFSDEQLVTEEETKTKKKFSSKE